MKVEHLLIEKNYYLIEESNYFEQLELDIDLITFGKVKAQIFLLVFHLF
jgi:hypothetical protein